jgi:hypothetical protein
MPKHRLSDEQILTVVKQMEAGRTAELAREVGVSQHTIYAWSSVGWSPTKWGRCGTWKTKTVV